MAADFKTVLRGQETLRTLLPYHRAFHLLPENGVHFISRDPSGPLAEVEETRYGGNVPVAARAVEMLQPD